MPGNKRPSRKATHSSQPRTPRDRRAARDRGITALSEVLSVNRTVKDCAPGEQAKRLQDLHDAVTALQTGTCTGDHMGHLIDAANIAGFRLDDGAFPEAVLDVLAAKAAIESLHQTWEQHGRYIPHGHEINNLRAFIDVFDAMMRNSTPKEWNTAQRKLVAAYSRIHRKGNPA